MDQSSLSLFSPLVSLDKYHPILTKLEIQNLHPWLINNQFPEQHPFSP